MHPIRRLAAALAVLTAAATGASAATAAAAAASAAAPATAAPVLMISIDGLRPARRDRCAGARAQSTQPARDSWRTATYAKGVRNVLPTVTYPNHTTLITGVAPALHGITNNVAFDPLRKNMEGWSWYARDIKVRRSGMRCTDHRRRSRAAGRSASASPHRLQHAGILARRHGGRREADNAPSTPGLVDALEAAAGRHLAATAAGRGGGERRRAREFGRRARSPRSGRSS